MNLLNYLDRWVPSVVKDLFKEDLHLTDAQTSLPLTGFIVVYMLTSPIFGALADRWPRKVLIASGVILWSLATGAAAFATGFWTFLLARALVGVGEAAYATLAPPLISDFYSKDRRNRILTIFYMATPLGAALGFGLGGLLGQQFGWRAAFLICGLPGILVGIAALWIRDPGPRPASEEPALTAPRWAQALPMLLQNRDYMLSVGGFIAVSFASGALADWFPYFLQQHRGMSIQSSGWYVGISAVIGGLGGTLAGGLMADYLKRWTARPYLALSACSMAIAAFFSVFAFVLTSQVLIVITLFVAQFFLWCYNGPINTMLANSVPGVLRVRAFALAILLIHLLGDAISPLIVGLASDVIGLPRAMSVVPVALGAGALIWAIGWLGPGRKPISG
jgi:MFS family permease